MSTNKGYMKRTYQLALLTIICGILVSIGVLSCGKKSAPPVNRYVVLSPEVAEILAGLGLTRDIVGVSAECDYPPELASLPKVGNFGMVDREAVIKLNPGIIFTSALEQDAIAAELAKLGYRVESVYPKSVAGMLEQISRLGKMLDRRNAAQKMTTGIQTVLDSLATVSKARPKPKVYIEINRDPLMSVSDQSFVGQLLEAAGGDNVFGALARDYCRISPEDVVRAAPDIIICYSQDPPESIRARKGWQDIPAIRANRIYIEKDIDPDLIQRAGPRSVDGLRRLRAIYNAWEQSR